MGGNPTSHTPAHDVTAVAAPFQVHGESLRGDRQGHHSGLS